MTGSAGRCPGRRASALPRLRRCARHQAQSHPRRCRARMASLVVMAEARVGISGWRLPGLAQDLLPGGSRRSKQRARVRRRAPHLDRDQRVVLRPAEAHQLPAVARRDARRLRLLGQGSALHHPSEEARRRRDAAGQLLCLRRARARPQARPGAVAAAAQPRPDRGAACRVLRPAPSHDRRRRTLAEQHDERIPDDRALTTRRVDQPMRHAMEVRHPTLATTRALDDPARARRRHRASPTPPASGRWSTRSRPTSPTCACTAPTSSTSAATPTRPSTAGPRRSTRLVADGPRHVRLLRQRRQGARAVQRDGADRRASS